MLRKLLLLVVLVGPSLAAMAAALPGQSANFDLGADVRGVTYLQRNPLNDFDWDFAAATSDGVKIVESSTSAPGGYIVYTLVDPSNGQSTAGQDVVAIANPDTAGDGTRELAWVVRTGTGLQLWCAYFEGNGYSFQCSSHQDLGGSGAMTVVAAGAYLDAGVNQDLVVLNGDKVYTLLSGGVGYGPPTVTQLPGPAAGLAVGDFTADGVDDIAVTIGPNVVTYQNLGGGALQQLQVVVVGGSLGRIAAGNVDKNGIADLAVVDQANASIRIINGGPTNPPHVLGQKLAPFPSGLGVTSVFDLAFDDRDGGGDDDLVIAANNWIILEENAAGTFGYDKALPGLGQTAQVIATNTHQEMAEGGLRAILIYKKSAAGAFQEGDTLLIGRGALSTQPPEGRAYSGNGAPMSSVIRPYGATGWGVNVAAGDVATQPDGALGRDVDEALFAPGPGTQYGPQVRAFRPPSQAWIPKVNFYAYGTLRYGANVAAGDMDGDGPDEMITGAGAGAVFGPHVRAFAYDGSSLKSVSRVSFFAYSTLKYGVNPSAGNIDRDASVEIVTGPGPGAMFSPQVRGWNFDGVALASIDKVNFNAFDAPRYGAKVAEGDFDDDGMAEIAAGPGPGGSADFPARLRGFNYDAKALEALPGFDVTTSTASSYGAVPGSARLDPSDPVTADTVVASSGPQPGVESRVEGWIYTGGVLDVVDQLDFTSFTPSEGGATLTAGEFY